MNCGIAGGHSEGWPNGPRWPSSIERAGRPGDGALPGYVASSAATAADVPVPVPIRQGRALTHLSLLFLAWLIIGRHPHTPPNRHLYQCKTSTRQQSVTVTRFTMFTTAFQLTVIIWVNGLVILKPQARVTASTSKFHQYCWILIYIYAESWTHFALDLLYLHSFKTR